MTMDNLMITNCAALSDSEMKLINGGSPIIDAVEWYYKTLGSFYRGIWDGLAGNEPIA